MSIEIPDAAIEAAKDINWALSEETYRKVLASALPHLRASILADLRAWILSESGKINRDSSPWASGYHSALHSVRRHIDDTEGTGQ